MYVCYLLLLLLLLLLLRRRCDVMLLANHRDADSRPVIHPRLRCSTSATAWMAHGLSVRLSGWLAGCGLAEFSISVVAMAGGSEYGEIKQAKHHPRTRIRGDAAPGIMHPSAIRSLAMLASVPYTCIALLLSVIVISEPAARQAGRQPDRQPADTSPTPSLLPAFPEEHLNGTTGSAANCGGFVCLARPSTSAA